MGRRRHRPWPAECVRRRKPTGTEEGRERERPGGKTGDALERGGGGGGGGGGDASADRYSESSCNRIVSWRFFSATGPRWGRVPPPSPIHLGTQHGHLRASQNGINRRLPTPFRGAGVIRRETDRNSRASRLLFLLLCFWNCRGADIRGPVWDILGVVLFSLSLSLSFLFGGDASGVARADTENFHRRQGRGTL